MSGGTDKMLPLSRPVSNSDVVIVLMLNCGMSFLNERTRTFYQLLLGVTWNKVLVILGRKTLFSSVTYTSFFSNFRPL